MRIKAKAPEADALSLRLSDAAVESSEEVAPNVVLDVDAEGRVVGVELPFVSELPDSNPMSWPSRSIASRPRAA